MAPPALPLRGRLEDRWELPGWPLLPGQQPARLPPSCRHGEARCDLLGPRPGVWTSGGAYDAFWRLGPRVFSTPEKTGGWESGEGGLKRARGPALLGLMRASGWLGATYRALGCSNLRANRTVASPSATSHALLV